MGIPIRTYGKFISQAGFTSILLEMPSVPLTAVLLVAVLNHSAAGATIPDHIMSDPSFLQCLSQHSNSQSVDIVSIVATCYGFVGRPRFGKRFDAGLVRAPLHQTIQSQYRGQAGTETEDYEW